MTEQEARTKALRMARQNDQVIFVSRARSGYRVDWHSRPSRIGAARPDGTWVTAASLAAVGL